MECVSRAGLTDISRISARFIKINKVEHEVGEREGGKGIIIKILILIRKFCFNSGYSLGHEAWEKIVNINS